MSRPLITSLLTLLLVASVSAQTIRSYLASEDDFNEISDLLERHQEDDSSYTVDMREILYVNHYFEDRELTFLKNQGWLKYVKRIDLDPPFDGADKWISVKFKDRENTNAVSTDWDVDTNEKDIDPSLSHMMSEMVEAVTSGLDLSDLYRFVKVSYERDEYTIKKDGNILVKIFLDDVRAETDSMTDNYKEVIFDYTESSKDSVSSLSEKEILKHFTSLNRRTSDQYTFVYARLKKQYPQFSIPSEAAVDKEREVIWILFPVLIILITSIFIVKKMKNKPSGNLGILLLVVSFYSTSCELPQTDSAESTEEIETEKTIDLLADEDLKVQIIDGCEYLVMKDSKGTNKGYGFMAHKGNCKNLIHQFEEIETVNQL